MTTTTETGTESQTVDGFAGRVFDALLGALDTWTVYVGDKFGLYDDLVAHGPTTAAELSSRTGMHIRYATEWLEQQVTTGFVAVDDPAAPAAERRFSMDPAQAEVLADPTSDNFLTPFIRLAVAGAVQLPTLLSAYATGGGVPWERFGEDMRTGQAEANRPWFLNHLGQDWFPSVPELHERLQAGGRVADVGCGEGWSSIAMARAYPQARVDGYDIDAPSIEAAIAHARTAGVADRVAFHHLDVAELDASRYDVVTAFECVHDMPDPVGVLTAIERIAADDAIVVVMDEAVGDAFGERDDEVERLMYGLSMFVCLPDGMSHAPSVATGTVMRPSTLAEYAAAAGFGSVEVLPIENDLWRFYLLDR